MDYLTYLKNSRKDKDILLEAFTEYYHGNDDFEMSIVNIALEDEDSLTFKCYIKIEIQYSYNIERDREESNWYIVTCDGSFINSDISIVVKDINKETDFPIIKRPLSKEFLPIIPKTRIEDEAKIFLDKYYPEIFRFKRMDRDILLSRMGLKIEKLRLSLDNKEFGLICYRDGIVNYYENNDFLQKKVTRGTIIIDPYCSCLYGGNNSDNFTIIHECVHWHLHQKYLLFKTIKDNYLSCKNSIMDDEKSGYMEYHANSIASNIILESSNVKRLVDFFKLDDFTLKMKNCIEYMSFYFRVSREAVKIRLLELGYKVKGIYEYVDNDYVRDYSYKNDLDKNETYSIPVKYLLVALLTHYDLYNLFESCNYLFVENHVCLKNEKYIKYNKDSNEFELTDYALANMDECCIRFRYFVDKKRMYNSDGYIICRANSKGDTLRIESFKSPNTLTDNPTCFLEDSNKTSNLIAEITPLDIHDALRLCRTRMGVSRELLAENSSYSSQNIKNIETQSRGVSLKNVLRIALGLHLNPNITMELIRKAGYTIDDFAPMEKQAYIFIINNFYIKSKVDIDKFLVDINMNPLFDDRGDN